jgi:hypothetical protein
MCMIDKLTLLLFFISKIKLIVEFILSIAQAWSSFYFGPSTRSIQGATDNSGRPPAYTISTRTPPSFYFVNCY